MPLLLRGNGSRAHGQCVHADSDHWNALTPAWPFSLRILQVRDAANALLIGMSVSVSMSRHALEVSATGTAPLSAGIPLSAFTHSDPVRS